MVLLLLHEEHLKLKSRSMSTPMVFLQLLLMTSLLVSLKRLSSQMTMAVFLRKRLTEWSKMLNNSRMKIIESKKLLILKTRLKVIFTVLNKKSTTLRLKIWFLMKINKLLIRLLKNMKIGYELSLRTNLEVKLQIRNSISNNYKLCKLNYSLY